MNIENFYTTTVYRKGAEVIRMLATMVGEDVFRKGIDTYFELFDGQAVTTDDFVTAIEKGSGRNFKQFRRWYHQAGTPTVKVESQYDAKNSLYTLTFTQSNILDGEEQESLHIPIAYGLVNSMGKDFESGVIELTKEVQSVSFELHEEPIPSLLRNFSAPVKLEYEYSDDDLAFLSAHDSDLFNRYEASQRISKKGNLLN